MMMCIRRASAAAMLGAAAWLAACADGVGDPEPTVASVNVTPDSATLGVGGTVQLSVTLRDANGQLISDRTVAWTSEGPAIATVDGNGRVTGRAAGTTAVTATSEGVSDAATLRVTAPPSRVRFASVEAGAYHACALATSGAAYCWGNNWYAQLGNGSLSDYDPPNAIAGDHEFSGVSVGAFSSCGLTSLGAASCWGHDGYGQLGAGTAGPDRCVDDYPCSWAPIAVAGGLTFQSLGVGWPGACGLTAEGAAYCWGNGISGRLGIGAIDDLESCIGPCTRTPLAVAGGRTFTALAVGVAHTCALTSTGAAYCWGDNSGGQLGVGVDAAPDTCGDSTGSFPCGLTPVPVAGGLSFTLLRAGLYYTCGRATTGSWYCWGSNTVGQLGTGTTEGPDTCSAGISCSSVPVQVSVGDFAAVFPGWRHSCGITSSGTTHCWGLNASGQLGDGTRTSSAAAVLVAGGHAFASVSPYQYHTCALSSAGTAYCWGANSFGQLGDGTTALSSVPVQVAAPEEAVSAAAANTRGAELPRLRSPSAPVPVP